LDQLQNDLDGLRAASQSIQKRVEALESQPSMLMPAMDMPLGGELSETGASAEETAKAVNGLTGRVTGIDQTLRLVLARMERLERQQSQLPAVLEALTRVQDDMKGMNDRIGAMSAVQDGMRSDLLATQQQVGDVLGRVGGLATALHEVDRKAAEALKAADAAADAVDGMHSNIDKLRRRLPRDGEQEGGQGDNDEDAHTYYSEDDPLRRGGSRRWGAGGMGADDDPALGDWMDLTTTMLHSLFDPSVNAKVVAENNETAAALERASRPSTVQSQSVSRPGTAEGKARPVSPGVRGSGGIANANLSSNNAGASETHIHIHNTVVAAAPAASAPASDEKARARSTSDGSPRQGVSFTVPEGTAAAASAASATAAAPSSEPAAAAAAAADVPMPPPPINRQLSRQGSKFFGTLLKTQEAAKKFKLVASQEEVDQLRRTIRALEAGLRDMQALQQVLSEKLASAPPKAGADADSVHQAYSELKQELQRVWRTKADKSQVEVIQANLQDAIDAIRPAIDGKADGLSLATLQRRFGHLGEQVRDLQRKAITAAREPKQDDSDRAALSGKPLLRDFKCLSCDRPLDQLTTDRGAAVPSGNATNSVPVNPSYTRARTPAATMLSGNLAGARNGTAGGFGSTGGSFGNGYNAGDNGNESPMDGLGGGVGGSSMDQQQMAGAGGGMDLPSPAGNGGYQSQPAVSSPLRSGAGQNYAQMPGQGQGQAVQSVSFSADFGRSPQASNNSSRSVILPNGHVLMRRGNSQMAPSGNGGGGNAFAADPNAFMLAPQRQTSSKRMGSVGRMIAGAGPLIVPGSGSEPPSLLAPFNPELAMPADGRHVRNMDMGQQVVVTPMKGMGMYMPSSPGVVPVASPVRDATGSPVNHVYLADA
jgi:hypothetical protein